MKMPTEGNIEAKSGPEPRVRDIYFAAGCFWGAEKFFKLVDGVVETEVGFANGDTPDPTYREVYTDTTGYAETVRVRFDSDRVSVADLVGLFFKIIDPFSVNRQGEDEGTRYRTGVYYADAVDGEIAESIISQMEQAAGRPFAVERMPLRNFYPAEEMHQDYLDKNPGGYCHLSPAFFELARSFRKTK